MTTDPDLIEQFAHTRGALLRAADAVPPSLRGVPFVGHWHLGDVLAHLVGWDYANVEAIASLQEGHLPAFYAAHDPGWAKYNQQLIEHHATGDWEALRAALDASRDAVLASLRSLSAEDLTRPHAFPGRKRPVTIAGILRAAIRDEEEHREQIAESFKLKAKGEELAHSSQFPD